MGVMGRVTWFWSLETCEVNYEECGFNCVQVVYFVLIFV